MPNFLTPRSENQSSAPFHSKNEFSLQVKNYQRINNKRETIPIVPFQEWGYQHPKGEVHLISPGHAVACSGADSNVTSIRHSHIIENLFGRQRQ